MGFPQIVETTKLNKWGELCVQTLVMNDGVCIGRIIEHGKNDYGAYADEERDWYIGRAKTKYAAKKLIVDNYTNGEVAYCNGKNKRTTGTKVKYLPASDNSDFYPTPGKLAGMMFEMLDLHSNNLRYRPLSILEPSAGKGDLVDAFRSFMSKQGKVYNERIETIDCIETDQNLQYLLRGKGEHLVHNDFMTFNTRKRYDIVVMNPPFSAGDKHLLKALDLMKDGGQIVCLLNAETIKNPYTNRRHLLVQQLDKLNAKIRYVKHAFTVAERKTGVEVAIVYVNIPESETGESEIYERLKKAYSVNFGAEEINAVASANPIENLIQTFNIEVDASLEFFKQYNALVPYIREADDGKSSPLIGLSLRTADNGDGKYCGYVTGTVVNTFLKAVRAKYWAKLFENHDLMEKFTSNILNTYRKRVKSLADYDFTEFNIFKVLEEMSAELNWGVEESIMGLFEKLSFQHSWYPECSQNIHYFNGWKTNKAHKVGMKVIIPSNRAYSSYSHDEPLNEWNCCDLLSDLEKSLNYLNNGNVVDVNYINLREAIKMANTNRQTKGINCTYFSVTFYKKGTCHIKFHAATQALIDRLNIFAAQHLGWLPPSYGKVRYDSMDAESQEVINSFQGKDAYERVMEQPSLYLIDTSSIGLLTA